MIQTPLRSALYAECYIVAVASVLFYGSRFAESEDSVLAPIAMLSLFVLSAAVMVYLFCYTPIILYLDGKKAEAFTYFMRTLLSFGIITLMLLCALFAYNLLA